MPAKRSLPKSNASRHPAERKDVETETAIILSGRTLFVARLIWLAVSVFVLAVFAAKLAAIFNVGMNPSDLARGLIEQLGITPAFRTAYIIGIESISALVFFIVAAALARFRSDHLAAFMASIALVTFGAAGALLDVLIQVDARWQIPVSVLGFLYRTTFIIFLFVFPDGRFIPRWTKGVSACWIVIALLIILPPQVPLSVVNWPPFLGAFIQIALLGTVVYAQIHRYRQRSNAIQRQQTRWVVYGIIVAMTVSFGAEIARFIFPTLGQPSRLGLFYELVFVALWDLSLALIPLTVGIAILRRRLYEIDLIINRTLVYVPLSALVAGLFAATVRLSQKLFTALTGQTSDIALIPATLVIVAAFTPIKDLLQGLVDKRFGDDPRSIRRLEEFGEQVRLRLAPVEPSHLMRRLLDETITALEAQGGEAYLDINGKLERIHVVGESNEDDILRLPLMAEGKRIGVLTLGPRRKKRNYSTREQDALQALAEVVARAVVQDRDST